MNRHKELLIPKQELDESKIGVNRNSYNVSARARMAHYDISDPGGCNAEHQLGVLSVHLNEVFGLNSKIYDLGCGFARHYSRLVKWGHQYVGIDFASKQIELAKELYPDGNFLVGDITDLDVKEGDAHGIWCVATLYSFPIEKAVISLKSMKRLLHPDGVAHVMHYVGNGDSMSVIDYEQEFWAWTLGSEEQLFEMAEEAGLKVVKQFNPRDVYPEIHLWLSHL